MNDIVADTPENPNREREDADVLLKVRRWFLRIHDPIRRKQALANAKEQGVLDEKTEYLADAIKEFNWEKTPEGEEYWQDYWQRQEWREEGDTDDEIEEKMNPQIKEETPEERKDKFADQDKNVDHLRQYTSLQGKTVSEWIQSWRPDGLYEMFEDFHGRMKINLRHSEADTVEHDFEQALARAFPFLWNPEGERYWSNFHTNQKEKTLKEWDEHRIKPIVEPEEVEPEKVVSTDDMKDTVKS